jgi:hypothetical protein
MARKKVTVQADRAYLGRFKEVARGLAEAGMTVQDEIAPLGHFRGVADADKIEHLKAVPGVALVDVTGDEGEEERDDYSISTEQP